jgi:hypothetical protein
VTEPTDARERAIEAGADALDECYGPNDENLVWELSGARNVALTHEDELRLAAAVLDAALATGAVVDAPTDPLIPVNRMRAAEARCAELERASNTLTDRCEHLEAENHRLAVSDGKRAARLAELEAGCVVWRDRSIAASNRAGQFRFEAEGLRDRLAEAEKLLRDWQKWWRRGHLHDPRPIIGTEAFLAEGDT